MQWNLCQKNACWPLTEFYSTNSFALCLCLCLFLVCYIPPLWHAFSMTAFVFFSQSMCKTVNGCNSCRSVAASPMVMVLLPEIVLLTCCKNLSYSENIQFLPSLTVTVACDCNLLLVSCCLCAGSLTFCTFYSDNSEHSYSVKLCSLCRVC